MSDKYTLEGKTPVLCDDLMAWVRNFEKGTDRHVAADKIGDVRVSTVFLGLDHSWGDGPPLLFETMIFEGPHDGYQERYSTWEQAEEGHKRAVKMVQSPPPPSEVEGK